MGKSTVRQEVHVVREVLEGTLNAELATALMFEALEAHGAVPETLDEVLALCRGALGDVVLARAGERVRDEVLHQLESVLADEHLEAGSGEEDNAPDGDSEEPSAPERAPTPSSPYISVEVDLDEHPSITTVIPTVWEEPVGVLVISRSREFAVQLFASLGGARVDARTVTTEPELRRAVFTSTPLLVLVDATRPAEMSTDAISVCLRALPDSITPVLWATDTDYGQALARSLRVLGIDFNGLRQADGVAPLLDLVLSRYQGS